MVFLKQHNYANISYIFHFNGEKRFNVDKKKLKNTSLRNLLLLKALLIIPYLWNMYVYINFLLWSTICSAVDR